MHDTFLDYGNIIKTAREKRNMTQTQLGDKIGVGKTTISNYETNYSIPGAQMLEKIAAALGYSLVEMISINNTVNADNLELPRMSQSSSSRFVPFISHKNIRKNILEVENYMDYHLTIPEFMLNTNDKYLCVKMPDNSLNVEKIMKNDYLFIRRSSFVPNASLVLAINTMYDTYIIRRYFRDGHTVAFLPESTDPEYSIIKTDERDGEYKIIGYVEKILTNIKQP